MLSAKLTSRRLVLTSISVGMTSTASRSRSSCGTSRVRCAKAQPLVWSDVNAPLRITFVLTHAQSSAGQDRFGAMYR